mmetsp:Transcript_53091/g.103891  ORF Transcript_53091/g.103891 Transcript_53091/m.103891 type:complete len:221 (+) Transcript_53091:754-1416(+)
MQSRSDSSGKERGGRRAPERGCVGERLLAELVGDALRHREGGGGIVGLQRLSKSSDSSLEAHTPRQRGELSSGQFFKTFVFPQESRSRVDRNVVSRFAGDSLREDESGRPVGVPLFEDFLCDVIARSQFVRKSVALRIQQNPAFSSEHLSAERLLLCRRVLRVHKRRRVELHTVHVHQLPPHTESELHAVSRRTFVVGCREFQQVLSELFHERLRSSVRR